MDFITIGLPELFHMLMWVMNLQERDRADMQHMIVQTVHCTTLEVTIHIVAYYMVLI